MEMYQDGVKVFCILGVCSLDEENRNIADIAECPIGEDFCTGDCFYYKE